jgi:cytochrome c oxidase cbb3-type subunit III
MHDHRRNAFLGLAPALFALGLIAGAQAAPQNLKQKNVTSSSARGKQTFSSTCASCHGLDGKGSERAPNIADRPNVQRLSDAQIIHIIENGIPGTGMPAFHSLEGSQIREVVAYLRTLQGKNKTARLPGNPERGKAIFVGKAGCSECHMVAGEGGFIASDLSTYAHVHEVEQIRSAITEPDSNNAQKRFVTVTLRGGEKYAGRARDEDNFSLQLQTLDGAFHFLSKSDIDKVEYDSHGLMPSDYASRLSAGELNDVVSYLMTVAGASEGGTPKVDEGEQ